MNPLGSISSKVWDIANRISATVDPLGNFTTVIRDANGRQIASQNPLGFLSSTVYDLASRTIAQVDSLGNRNTTIWDARNLAIAQVNPLGFAVSTTFNANRDAIASMDPGGFIVSTILDNARNVIASLDANGNLSSIVRDAANRPIAQVNALDYRTSTSYDANSNAILVTDSLGRSTTYTMDPLDRVQATTTPLGFATTVVRDSAGRSVAVQNAQGCFYTTVFDAASNSIASVTPLGFRATTVYDSANQTLAQQNALGLFYTVVRDAAGKQIGMVSPLGYRTTQVWDQASQLIATVDALGNFSTNVFSANGQTIAEQNELGYITSFTLDAASQRICVVDANGGRSTTIFTNRGFTAAEQNQLGIFTSFTQDPNGNTVLRVDGRNWPTTFTIDALNRTSGKLYIDSSRVTSTWDQAGQQLSCSDVTGLTQYVWDLNSRKTAVQNPTGINLTATLDALGNRLVLQDNFGSTTYQWDQQSRLASIWNPLNERTTLTWDALDREQGRVLANGMSISHTWDNAGRETAIGNYNAAGTALALFTNTYSAVDNRLTVLELDGTRATFSYDPTSQIISESRGGTMAYARSYVWDPNGNRSQQFDSGLLTSGQFNAANQQILITPPTGPPTTQSFDNTGNLILENTGGALVTSTWIAGNRLASYVDSTGDSVSSLYSDDGLRRQRTTNGVTRNLTYDDTVLLLETDTTGNLDARYTNYPEVTGGIISQNLSGVSSFFGFDTQGSARIIVSSGGAVTDNRSWKAFGEPIQTGSGTVTPYGYVAQAAYYVELADLFNAWNRWMKPSMKQWRSVDPIGWVGGDWNNQRYVGNEPLGRQDPSGLAVKGCTPQPGARIDDPSVPWKVVPDPDGPPVTTLPENQKKYCWIVVDQFCEPYCNAEGQVDEHVQPVGDSNKKIGVDTTWNPMVGANPTSTLPKFCDTMHGKPGTANLQCYSVSYPDPNNPTKTIRIILEPCPFTVNYGPNGPVRTSPGKKGKVISWG